MQLKFIPLDYDYFDYQGRNHVKIIGRDEKGKRICLIDTCPIYFWAILHSDTKKKQIQKLRKKIEKIEVEKASRKTKVLKTELHEKQFLEKSVKAIKIFISNYKDAHAIADELDFKEIDKRREYDLSFITKYIIEKQLTPLQWHEIEAETLEPQEFNGIENIDVDICFKVNQIQPVKKHPKFNPKILAYDIETTEIDIGKGEIIMVSLVGNNFKKVLTTKPSKKKFVETFDDEADLLEAFVENVKEYQPDILTGYFSDGFDLPYLRARAEKNKINLGLGVDNSKPKFSRGRITTGKINGIIHIDLLRFIQNTYSQYMKSETLSLNEVASEFLQDEKIKLSPLEQANSETPDWEKFFDYNLQDSDLVYRLIKKFWPDLLEFSKIVQEPLFDISRNSMATHVENYIIHNLHRYNEIIERKPPYNEIGERRAREKYEGAFVFQPTPGLYKDLYFFDFSSMYASVIISYNLSKSTLTDKKNKSYKAMFNKSPIYFTKKPGFFPQMMKEIVEKRREFKKEYNKNPDPVLRARSNAFKLIANAAYGYQGYFGARYYCLEAAAATAYFARQNIKLAIEKFKKSGFTPIYSDTDSVVITLNKKSKKQALSTLKQINNNLPGIMSLDLEGFFKRGIWVTKRTGEYGAKKKYALINEKDEIKIRGFETVRRDWCKLARDTQNKVLQLILKNGNEKPALKYLKTIIKKLKNRKIDKKELIIKTQLKKPISEYKSEPPHVTIAKKMREKEMPIDIGMLIEYYVATNNKNNNKKSKKSKELVRERAKLPTEKGDYDINYYLNNQILPAVENILEVFSINIKALIEGKEQKKLGDF